MAYLYSKALVNQPSVSGPTALGTPPAGKIWVIRTAILTYGSYAGFFRGALSCNEQASWQWLWSTSSDAIIGLAHASLSWYGRYVVPAGQVLYGTVAEGDTADFYLAGYELTDDS